MASPFSLNLAPLSPELQKRAEVELRETPEIVAAAILELRELVENDDTIYFKTDDKILIMYLRPCKFYAKSAYELMKRIAAFREKHKDILENLLPSDERTAFTEYGVVTVLKDRDHKGRRVLVVNSGSAWDPSKVTTDQLFRMFYLIHEAALLEEETQVNGVVVIMDYDGLGMKQVKCLTPAFSMKLLGFIQEAMPLRLKEVHMVKQPFVFNMVWQIFKPFIKEKLKNRIHFHGSKMASLHKFIPPTHLPKDYDGVLPAINYSGKEWYPVIEEHIEHIKMLNRNWHVMPICVETDNDGVPFVTLGSHQLRLDLEEISGEFEERAKTELLETPERIQEGLKKFRELINAEKGLNLPIDDDKFLLKFLRPFKCNAEQAFKMMKKFYRFKVKNPKYGGLHVTPEGVRHVFDSEVFMFLPTRSLYGGRIMIINAGTKWKPKEVPLVDMFRSIMVSIEIAMMEPKTQVGGANVIIDLEGLSLTHVYQFSPSMAKLIVDWVQPTWLQECAPVRLRGIHIINQPYLFSMLYALFKPFLGEYLKKRLSFHGTDYKSLCDKIGESSLPRKFAGTADIPDYPGSIFSEMLFYYQNKFQDFYNYGYIAELNDIQLTSDESVKSNGTSIKTCSKAG
ncbi:hypothetical protein YQE_06264, partial [Dendroctonus ponderosae]